MTILDALQRRIPRVRLAVWSNPNAYLRLPLVENNAHSPWAELYDDKIQTEVLHVMPGSQKFPVFGSWTKDDSDWIEYTGSISPFEQHESNYSRMYLEK